ncbi:hypothetical protein MZO42_17610 [Sphingomonas psychrotolerans]|uniref:Uncharacterized protein n=1 Tax=Sphingomonas psychrotolerans TaxID=1327635 RepID=A0ABU3N872_9SPHN|nr:hypothetical protein [Sphingomonas psychrotolerans]MDT8760521.1 hypothetical protein [Sphingomonas psychrotolerans]
MSLKNRLLPSVNTVGAALLPLEDAAHGAAAQAHRAVATMIDERTKAHKAGAAADFGAEAIAMASRGADYLTLAANCFGQSHQALASLLGDLGFGPQCPVGHFEVVSAA